MMTEQAFVVQRNPKRSPFSDSTPASEPPATIDSLLNVPYLRTQQIRASETTPLYGSVSTDYGTPTVRTDLSKWYLEAGSAPFDYESAGSEFSSSPTALAQGSNRAFYAPSGFDSFIDNGTFFYVAERGSWSSSLSSAVAWMTIAGHLRLSLYADRRIRLIYATASGGRSVNTPSQDSKMQGKFSLTVVVRPTLLELFVNGILVLSEAISGSFLSQTIAQTRFHGLTANPRFFAQWTGANQPSVADLQTLLFPAT